MTAAEFARRLNAKPISAERWMALCPAHNDRRPSLQITQGQGGVLLRCWAGCPTEAVLNALNLSWSDLFPPREPGQGPRMVRLSDVPNRVDPVESRLTFDTEELMRLLYRQLERYWQGIRDAQRRLDADPDDDVALGQIVTGEDVIEGLHEAIDGLHQILAGIAHRQGRRYKKLPPPITTDEAARTAALLSAKQEAGAL